MTWIRFFKASVFGLTRNLQKIGQNFLKERRNKDPTKLMPWIKSTERNRIKTRWMRFQSIVVGLSILIRNLKKWEFLNIKGILKNSFRPNIRDEKPISRWVLSKFETFWALDSPLGFASFGSSRPKKSRFFEPHLEIVISSRPRMGIFFSNESSWNDFLSASA